ncbi:hypothetical protein D3C76_1191760 [compost metagenome]
MPLDFIVHANYRTLGHCRVAGHQVLHFAGGQPVPGHVDHVIRAPHDVDKTVIVQKAAVAGVVIPRVGAQVSLQVTLVVAPQGLAAPGWQWQGDDDRALVVGAQQVPLVIHHTHVVARYRPVA